MFTQDYKIRDKFINERIGGIERLTGLAYSVMAYMYGYSYKDWIEDEGYTTEGYMPGIIIGIHKNEDNEKLLRMIVDDELRSVQISQEVEKFINSIKATASDDTFEWTDEELDNYTFMNGRIIMFKAVNNTIVHFYAISINEYQFIDECIDTITQLCCKEDE